MSTEARDVIKTSDFRFKDTGELDLKPARLCLVMLVGRDDDVYYLTLATHNGNVMEKYQKYPECNYLLTKEKCEGLPKTSLVNLQSIYRGDIGSNYIVMVPSEEYEKMMQKFKRWQETNPDDLYEEVRPMLEWVD